MRRDYCFLDNNPPTGQVLDKERFVADVRSLEGHCLHFRHMLVLVPQGWGPCDCRVYLPPIPRARQLPGKIPRSRERDRKLLPRTADLHYGANLRGGGLQFLRFAGGHSESAWCAQPETMGQC